jgi:TolB-like protein/DNA-binding winged helix-turn-helix (wHTH) protein
MLRPEPPALPAPFLLANHCIDPAVNEIDGQRVDSKAMDVLVCLADAAPGLVTSAQLLERVWPSVVVGDNVLHQAIAHLRKALGDQARSPRFIENVPRRGYRLLAEVRRDAGDRGAETGLDNGVLAPTLLDEIRQQGGDVQLAREPAPLSALAVMPFDDLSPAADHGWLVQGMAEELIDSLSRIKGLRVPARTTTSLLKERRSDIQTIADTLDVGSLVTGSVRCSADRINVSVQWIRASDHSHLWSARFERRMDDVIAIQHEIAVGIAEAIRTELGIFDTAQFVSKVRYRTRDTRAWQLFRQGFDLAFTFEPSRIEESRDYFRQALEIDPEYLDAQMWLAWGYLDEPETRVAGARQVLRREPSNATALIVLRDDAIAQWDFETAQRLWNHAIEMNPGDAALSLSGFHLFTCLGKLDAAMAVARRGARLDPLWSTHHYFLGLACLNLGDPSAAVDAIERGISLYDENTPMKSMPISQYRRSLSFALACLGRDAEALETMKSAFPEFAAEIHHGWASGGCHGMNRELADTLEDRYRAHWWRRDLVGTLITRLLACAGEAPRMYGLLERLIEDTRTFETRNRHAFRMCLALAQALHADAEFQGYRDEPRFRALVARLDERMANAAGSSGYASALPDAGSPHP